MPQRCNSINSLGIKERQDDKEMHSAFYGITLTSTISFYFQGEAFLALSTPSTEPLRLPHKKVLLNENGKVYFCTKTHRYMCLVAALPKTIKRSAEKKSILQALREIRHLSEKCLCLTLT